LKKRKFFCRENHPAKITKIFRLEACRNIFANEEATYEIAKQSKKKVQALHGNAFGAD
jgi:hypothetical protein